MVSLLMIFVVLLLAQELLSLSLKERVGSLVLKRSEPAGMDSLQGGEEEDVTGERHRADLCAICLEEFEQHNPSPISITDCIHAFHRDCLSHWVKLKGTCPVCRESPLPFVFSLTSDEMNDLLLTFTKEGNFPVVSELLSYETNVNVRDSHQMTPLLYAAALGFEEILQHLIDSDANIESYNLRRESALDLALRYGHLGCADKLIEAGILVDKEEELLYAAENGLLPELDLWIRHGARLDAKDEKENSALHLAFLNNCFECLKVLVESHAPLDIKDRRGRTPLMVAARRNDVEVLIFLLKKTPSVSETDNEGFTALHLAVKAKSFGCVVPLVKAGVPLNALNNAHETALLMASRRGLLEIVDYLLNRKDVDVNSPDINENSPLHYIARIDDLNLIQKLIEKGATIDTVSSSGLTPLMVAAKFGQVQVVKYLIQQSAIVTFKNSRGESALLLNIVYSPQYDICQCLIAAGAESFDSDDSGYTTLMAAIEGGNREIAELILDQPGLEPAFIDVWSDLKDCALVLACRHIPDVEFIKKMLDKGAFIDARGRNGNTPLTTAVLSGAEEVEKLLIERGADVNLKNDDGKTASDLHKELSR